MSSFSKPRLWLCVAAFASTFWITFRVLDADASPLGVSSTASAPTASGDAVSQDQVSPDRQPVEAAQPVQAVQEVDDPALAALIHRLAVASRHSRP
jgi:hypothetical protein